MYYRAWTTVLAYMKERFMEETGLTEEAFYKEDEIHQVQEIYYLKNQRHNLIQTIDEIHLKEFSRGKSVVSNLGYLASSYAMTFNMLGNGPVRFLDNCYGICPVSYDIEYKKVFRALKSKNAFVSVDACMFSKDSDACICMEMKMLEWFVFKINPIKDNFMEAENYFYPDTAHIFINVIQLLIPYLNRDGWEHFGSFQNCDGFLLLRQVLGLYGMIRMAKESNREIAKEQRRFEKLRELTVATVYWFSKDAECYGVYRERIVRAEQLLQREAGLLREIMEPIYELFARDLGVRLKVVYMEHKSFLNCVQKTEEEKKLLDRYDI